MYSAQENVHSAAGGLCCFTVILRAAEGRKRKTSCETKHIRCTGSKQNYAGQGAEEIISSPGRSREKKTHTHTCNENNLSKNGNTITISGLWKRQTNEGVADS